MTDYLHDVQFGIFPSPDAASAEHVLELAQLADVLGLDLVTVQDHPYQGLHLDTWLPDPPRAAAPDLGMDGFFAAVLRRKKVAP